VVDATFRWELLRAVTSGILETALLTFAVLIAIEAHQSGAGVKAFLLGSQSLGLIASLFIVPLVVKLRQGATTLASEINLISAGGYFLAAIFHNSLTVFVFGMSIGFLGTALQVPLQTHWMRHNYPNNRRGQIFSITSFVRASSSVLFSLLGGWALERDFAGFPLILAIFGSCSLLAAMSISMIPKPPPFTARPPGLFQAMRFIKSDATFRVILISAMAMGLGVIMSFALRVDYVANESFGLNYSETRVALLTSTLPAITRLATTMFWGRMFDRMNFILMRMILNILFGASLFLYFWTQEFWVICLGSALSGVARGGGEIVWTLWVTKLAPAENVVDYMSVHTFLTGLRGFVAPFLGFYLVGAYSLHTMVIICMCFVTFGVVTLIPSLFRWRPIEGLD